MRRNFGRRRQRCGHRRAEGDEIPHRVDHRHGAAGQDAVAAAHDPAADLHVDRREPVSPVPHARPRDRIRDERHPPARRLPHEPGRVLRQVDAVEDHLHRDVGRGERGARKARLARCERAHGVEEMRDGLRAVRERLVGLIGGRVRVAARDRDAARTEHRDQVERARELRRERDVRDATRGQQSLQQVAVGIAARGNGMRAETLRRDEGALEMRAEHVRGGAVLRHLAQRSRQILFGR